MYMDKRKGKMYKIIGIFLIIIGILLFVFGPLRFSNFVDSIKTLFQITGITLIVMGFIYTAVGFIPVMQNK